MRKTHPKKKCPKPLYAWNFAWESIENTTALLAQNTEIHLTGKGWKSVTTPPCPGWPGMLYEKC